MGKFIDLTGQTFGYLTVLGIDHKETVKPHGSRIFWRCCCKCGNECIVAGSQLKSRKTKSCGCFQIKRAKEANTTHGMNKTPIHRCWLLMKDRCYNPNCHEYHNYGGRGIKVCERWHIFQNFFDDVSKLPHFGEKGYSLDRIDVNGDYCSENVRWATYKQQCRNKTNNICVSYNGEKQTLIEVSEKSGIKPSTLYNRYRHGKRGEELFKPLEKTNIIVEYDGEEMTLTQAAEKSAINYDVLRYRYRHGKRGEDLFKPVKFQRKP